MSSGLERRVEKLEEQQSLGTIQAPDPMSVMAELDRHMEATENMTPDEVGAYDRACMESAPADSPLGRMREGLRNMGEWPEGQEHTA